jgi:hypothetical protein
LPRILPVAQWDSPTTTVEAESLPSVGYLATSAERQAGFSGASSGSLSGDGRAPSEERAWIVGLFARGQLVQSPGRVIHSAKSWLSHEQVDRREPILPWQSSEVPPGERLSPVTASSLYLRHLRECWDRSMAGDDPGARFNAQEIVVTVPASFDEVAQELTLEAAQGAGYPETLRLIEEPQAAFYDWLGQERNLVTLVDLLERVPHRTARVLVCDIGGGTTDLSLFEVVADPAAPSGLSLRRVAVSEHLLLGGDNIDLTLAHILEARLTGGGAKLTGRQWNQLLSQARDLKERTLGEPGEDLAAAGATHLTPDPTATLTVTLAGSGAGLLASTLSARIDADEVRRHVLEGFFPPCGPADRPQKKTSGLREWGLPYAGDTAVTRHLAAFVQGRRVDAVLYNGGTVIPGFLRRRLTDLLTEWQGGHAPTVLANDALSLAVARGAARYAHLLVEPEAGQRIAGGHAHALYLEVVHRKKKTPTLVCVLPKGMEANESLRLENLEFDLLVNQAVRFQCFFSNRREADRPGDVVAWQEGEVHPLPPLQTAIHLPPGRPKPANNRLRVFLEASLNELGLLKLFCVEKGGEGRWRLDFNLRRTAEEPQGAPAPEEPLVQRHRLEEAQALIQAVYGKHREAGRPELKPTHLPRELERALGVKRDGWDSATLRALWPPLTQGMGRRSRSVAHEEVWLYLAGYILRPGYGFALDESRIEELWRLYEMGMAHPKEKRVQVQWHLVWRRTAGGLNARRQEKVWKHLLPQLQSRSQETAETFYLAGSLERIPLEGKAQLVRWLTAGLQDRRFRTKEPLAWALGRLLTRTPLYAGPETVLAPDEVERLFLHLRALDWNDPAYACLNALFSQVARRTDRRGFDVGSEVRDEILAKMTASGARPEELRVVREAVPVEDADRVRQFGESLPSGLILVGEAG